MRVTKSDLAALKAEISRIPKQYASPDKTREEIHKVLFKRLKEIDSYLDQVNKRLGKHNLRFRFIINSRYAEDWSMFDWMERRQGQDDFPFENDRRTQAELRNSIKVSKEDALAHLLRGLYEAGDYTPENWCFRNIEIISDS